MISLNTTGRRILKSKNPLNDTRLPAGFSFPVGFQGNGPSGSDRALRPLGPALLVVPGGRHHKTIAEDAALMKAKVSPLNWQEDFFCLSMINGRLPRTAVNHGCESELL